MTRLLSSNEYAMLFGSLIDAGLYTVAKNPWLKGDLKAVVDAGLVKPDVSQKPYVVRKTPPWAKARLYMAGASVEQLQRWRLMAEVSSATAGADIASRIQFIRERLRTGRKAVKKLKGRAIVDVIDAEIAKRARAKPKQVAVATAQAGRARGGAPFTPEQG